MADKLFTIQGIHEIQIYYEDTDLSGFVYHANYLRYFERAREHLIGIDFLGSLLDVGLHFVVAKATLDFLSPALHGHKLLIKSRAQVSKSPRVAFEQTAYLYDGQKLGRIVVNSDIQLVILNNNNSPVRMPDIALQHFELLEKSQAEEC